MCDEISNGNWACDPAANWTTDQDPGFVDAAAGDFTLRPESEVFSRLPGFEPIPFGRIGLRRDTLRPELPEMPEDGHL